MSAPEDLENGPAYPYVGLKGCELVQWALRAGPECVAFIGSQQRSYFEAVGRRVNREFPDEFFSSTIQELMPHRFLDRE